MRRPHQRPHHRLPPSTCPQCGKLRDSATHIEGDPVPVAGDIGICIYCGHTAIYKRDMTLRQPTRREQIEIDNNQEVQIAKLARELTWWPGGEIKQ